jgi:L-lactate dehydrogenase complex protein LldE
LSFQHNAVRVGLFIPCYVNQFYPAVAIATLNLLESLGLDVHYPQEQTCCGQPLANTGLEVEALPVYRHFIKTFQGYDGIVAPSGSCVYHVRKHYDVIPQTPEVERIRRKTFELTEFLMDVIQVKKLEARFPHRVALLQSCHGLRGLRLAQSSERVLAGFSKWEELLALVEGLELTPVDFADECCGFGGTFSVQEPEVSVKMGQDKIAKILNSGAEYVTSGDSSCLMHLEGIIRRQKLPLKTIHLAEILTSS